MSNNKLQELKKIFLESKLATLNLKKNYIRFKIFIFIIKK